MKLCKRILGMLLAVVMIVGCISPAVFAAESVETGACGENLTWTLDTEGVLTISGTGVMDDYRETEPGWYSHRDAITRVVVEAGVGSIGAQAFADCTALKEVTFYGDAPAIAEDAFQDQIVTGNFPRTAAGWSEATQYAYGGSIDWMGYGDTENTPEEETETPVVSGSCGEDAQWALYEDGTLTVSGTGAMTDYGETAPEWYQYGADIKWVVVKPGITYVGAYAFCDLDNLSAMELPATVETIGEGAFMDCGNLYCAELPEGVKAIGLGTFAYSGITFAKIPASVEAIDYYAFGGCSKLKTIDVDESNSVCCDVDGVLYTKDKTQLVTLPGGFQGGYAVPAGVLSIGVSACAECPELYSITIPGTVINIGAGAFAASSDLIDIMFEGPAPVLFGEDCFSEISPTCWYSEGADGWTAELMQNYGGTPTWIAMADIPDDEPSVVVEGTCGENLTWVLMDDGVLTVSGTGMMENYPENPPAWTTYLNMITKIVIEEGVESIGDFAFFECLKVAQVELPSTLTKIGEGAFSLCVSLPEITIPAAVTEIGPFALHYCSNMTAIHVESGNQAYSSRDGVLFNAAGDTLILLPGGHTGSYAVPEGVTTIGASAFELCQKLTEVTLPESVTLLEEGAFWQAAALKSVTFTGNAPTFTGDVFEGTQLVCCYPADNETWTDEVKSSYGGTVVWAIRTLVDAIPGDTDVDGDVDVDDAIYLLFHLLFGEGYPVNQTCDFNGSGTADVDDAIYLLFHTLFSAEEYPLQDGASTGEPMVKLTLVAGENDLAALEGYPGLKWLDLTGSTCYEAIQAYMAAHPEVVVTYTATIGSSTYTNHTTELTISEEEFDLDQLLANLKYLPKVKLVDMTGIVMTPDASAALVAAYPDVQMKYSLELLGEVYSNAVTRLDLSAMTSEDVAEAVKALPGFTEVTEVELMDAEGKSELSLTDVKALQEAQPKALFHYSFKLFGKTVSTTDESIAYYDKKIGDAGEQEIRQALDILTSCTYFKLDNCNVSDEVMASIRDDYPEVKVVWRIWADRFTMCTDETMIRMTFNLDNKDIGSLKYCTDVTYMDIGHNTKLTDISFVEYMPNLECVIVSGAPVSDISYFADHDKLVWLELVFCDRLKDISCLDTCDNLTYLNISYTSVSDLSSLEHLPLERFNCMHTKVNAASRNQFNEWHPDCLTIFTGKQPYGYGWRYDDHGYTFFEYYANMRVVFRYDDKNYHGNKVERP